MSKDDKLPTIEVLRNNLDDSHIDSLQKQKTIPAIENYNVIDSLDPIQHDAIIHNNSLTNTETPFNGTPQHKKIKVNILNDAKLTALSGALAGFISGILVCPLDVTKTRLQAQGLQSSENLYYRGVIGTMSTIVRDEGVRGLYKGLVPIVLGYFPTWTIYFSVYETSKQYYPRMFSDWEFLSHSCSAITAGAVSTISTNPIWVIKTRLMLQNNLGETSTHYTGTVDAFRKILKQEGVRALYSGLVPSLLGLSHVAIHFPVYEKLKDTFHCYYVSYNANGERETSINIKNLIMASSISKMIASIITYPHEILRTRMQLKSNLPSRIQHKLIPMIRTTYINEGFKTFYSGFTANLLRTVPASAITLVSFEYFRVHFSKLLNQSTP